MAPIVARQHPLVPHAGARCPFPFSGCGTLVLVPELPEVEVYRRFFRDHAAGRTVRSVEADPTIVRGTDPATLDRALRGQRFAEPERLGKWMIGWTGGPALLLHFGMTGELIWSEIEPARHRHDRLVLSFDGGQELRYRNMRKLGGVWLAHGPEEVSALLGTLGPDALAVSRREFLRRLERRRGGVKAALMDQTLVAGVGNLIADEVLWQARLHPRRTIESMGPTERAGLYRAMHSVLRQAVESPDDYIPRKRSWLLHVRGEPGARCPRCRTGLDRTLAGGRTTYFCPRCQPEPEPAATMAS
jgi:formamidopyrimidine-DNA glycosylase